MMKILLKYEKAIQIINKQLLNNINDISLYNE